MKLFKLTRPLLNIADFEEQPNSSNISLGTLQLRLMDYDFPSDSFTAVRGGRLVRWREWRYRLFKRRSDADAV